MPATASSLKEIMNKEVQVVTQIVREIGDELEEDGVSVPSPIGLVEPKEINQPAGTIARSRARELTQADMVPSGAESETQI